MAIQRLTVAYRSRSRPSSTLGAKASTVCPYYLDGDLAQRNPIPIAGHLGCAGPGDTRYSAAAYRWRLIVASVQFSRTVERRITPAGLAYIGHVIKDESTRSPADAGLSKLNSMLGSLWPLARELPSSQGAHATRGRPARFGRHARPDPLRHRHASYP
jgi:hypothetical protein